MPPLLHRTLFDADEDKYPTQPIEETMMIANDQPKVPDEQSVFPSDRNLSWKYSFILILLLTIGYGSLVFFSIKNFRDAVQIKQSHDQSEKLIQTLNTRVKLVEQKSDDNHDSSFSPGPYLLF